MKKLTLVFLSLILCAFLLVSCNETNDTGNGTTDGGTTDDGTTDDGTTDDGTTDGGSAGHTHAFGEWIVDTAATCMKSGTRHHVCTVCNKSVSETYTDSTAHNYSTAWTTDGKNHWHKCLNSGCTSTKNKTVHSGDSFCSVCSVFYSWVGNAYIRVDAEGKKDANGSYILFGEYPQTLKADSVSVRTTADSRGYYLGSDGFYYAKVTAKPCDSGYTFSSGTSVTRGTVYYFKVEPIRWRILSEDGDTALILCDSIIANKAFDNYNGGNYDNNYADSTIRAWLNDQFFSTAFTRLQRDLINTVLVDNSAASTGYSSNPNACEDTNDKIFLLSYKEVTNSAYGFASSEDTSDTARQMTASDYARATGALMSTGSTYYGNGWWWLRSLCNDYDNIARGVYGNGNAGNFNYVDDDCIGVVPALQIRLR